MYFFMKVVLFDIILSRGRYPAERNLRVWKKLHAVELVRSGRLLTDWQELDPGHSFDLFDDFRHGVPVEG